MDSVPIMPIRRDERRVAHWQSVAITRQKRGFDSFRAYQSPLLPAASPPVRHFAAGIAVACPNTDDSVVRFGPPEV